MNYAFNLKGVGYNTVIKDNKITNFKITYSIFIFQRFQHGNMG